MVLSTTCRASAIKVQAANHDETGSVLLGGYGTGLYPTPSRCPDETVRSAFRRPDWPCYAAAMVYEGTGTNETVGDGVRSVFRNPRARPRGLESAFRRIAKVLLTIESGSLSRFAASE